MVTSGTEVAQIQCEAWLHAFQEAWGSNIQVGDCNLELVETAGAHNGHPPLTGPDSVQAGVPSSLRLLSSPLYFSTCSAIPPFRYHSSFGCLVRAGEPPPRRRSHSTPLRTPHRNMAITGTQREGEWVLL